MNNFFQEIKDKKQAEILEQEAQQNERIERLKELSEKKEGLHIPHPIQGMKKKKEIKSLKKEIAAYEMAKQNKKVFKWTAIVCALLTAFACVMAIFEEPVINDNSGYTESTDSISGEESVDNKIALTFSQNEIYYKPYEEVYQLFENLGFTKVDGTASEMNYSDKKQYDGAVIDIKIDNKSQFDKGSLYEPNVPVVINYVQDLRIEIPKSSVDCEGIKYNEIVNIFTNAGFTNVQAYGTEIEYTTEVIDRTVLIVSVDGNAIFEKGAKVEKDAEVIIHYYIILPEPVQTEQQNDVIVNYNDDGNNSQEMVWIPNSGSKYHSHSGCSNMKNPRQVTKEEAEEMGYEPCKRCH